MKPTRKNNDDSPVQYPNASAEKKQIAVSDITTAVAPLAPVNTNVPVPHTLLARSSATATKENQFPPSLYGFQAQNFSVSPTMMRSQEQTMINTFNNCQVSIIIGRSRSNFTWTNHLRKAEEENFKANVSFFTRLSTAESHGFGVNFFGGTVGSIAIRDFSF